MRAVHSRAVSPAERARPATGPCDLETIQRFASGPGPFAFINAPWTPIFLFALFTFHWMPGVSAAVSGVLLLLIALLNQLGTSRIRNEEGEAVARSAHFVKQMRDSQRRRTCNRSNGLRNNKGAVLQRDEAQIRAGREPTDRPRLRGGGRQSRYMPSCWASS